MVLKDFDRCSLCPRGCMADRNTGVGACHVRSTLKVARAALHMWEEPCISGKEGSGAVFFSGCSLGCVYCQNKDIARGLAGKEISPERLTEIFLELQAQNANNINLVTAGHYLPYVIDTVREARKQGLSIPIVYNSGGYEKAEAIKALEGTVDIFLPDFKYINSDTAAKYSAAPDYPKIAMRALEQMVSQTPKAEFDGRGIMKKGVIVRHLILPGHVKESMETIRTLYSTFGNDIYISIMNQYTPMPGIAEKFPELGRKITKREYNKVVDYALQLGIENGFIQEGKTAKESFIPEFDNTGV